MHMKISRQAYADMYGPTVGDKVRLADTELFVEVEQDFTAYGEEVKFGGGKVIRDGQGQSQLLAHEVVDTLITNALIIDHWGIVKADVGLKNGRIHAIGKAGNPDIQPGVTMAIGASTEVIAEQIHRLETVIGQGKLCEGFGMTETSGVTTINPPGRARIGSIGLPLPATRAKIVDAETGTQELPAGEPGELIFRGGQVMARYLGNPESTAKTIRDFEGELWLYSGDIATMDADGYITIVDRAKDMLIVGGYKVFSVEIEAKLAELACIAMSAVIGQPDQKRPGNDLVHLYVQLKADHKQRDVAAVTAEILAFCRANMAAYKIPKEVHVLEALPLTAVGKLDKKALRAQLQ